MRITDVNLPAMPERGLNAVKMQKLGQVVLIAGKNGAGKTRFFERLAHWPRTPQPVQNPIDCRSIAMLIENDAQSECCTISIESSREERLSIARKVHAKRHGLPHVYSDFAVVGTWPPHFVTFVPKVLGLKMPSTENTGTVRSLASNVQKDIGTDKIAQGTLSRILRLQDDWREATHQNPSFSPEECAQVKADYDHLRLLIRTLLNTELSRLGQEPTLFGLPIEKAGLSNGQTVLLQLAVAIHAQGTKLSDTILLMDEPENHLHPAALLDAIDAILPHLTEGQIWIATHSLPLLAHFDSSSLWWMEDGEISYAGDKPEKVLAGLVGDEERRGKLEVFLGLPAALASARFAFQCLLPPAVVDTPPADPQTNQIAKLLESHRPGESLRILDFGAGRGRLAAELADGGYDAEKLKQRVDYIAFDPTPDHRAACLAAIERLHEPREARYFNEEKALRTNLHDKSVDVVVMCNVLHEIEPSHWTSLFSEQGLVRQLLRDGGYLLVVEDCQMPVGEKAHQKGFLVLDTAELRKLFNITADDKDFVYVDARGDSRLKAHMIPKSVLGRITNETRVEAIKSLGHMARTEIKKLRDDKPTYKNGRLHQFYVQLLANTQLALE